MNHYTPISKVCGLNNSILHMFRKQDKSDFFFGEQTSYLAICFLSILRHQEAIRVPRRHSITSRTWCHRLSLISNSTLRGANIFKFFFWTSVPSGQNLFLIPGIKLRISGIVLYCTAHVSISPCNTRIIQYRSKVSNQSRLISCATRITLHATWFS